jgi:hypothetical protein
MRLAAFFFFIASVFAIAQSNAQTSGTGGNIGSGSSQNDAGTGSAQDPAIKPSPELQAIVHKQFGPDFEIAWKKSAGTGFKYRVEAKEKWTPFIYADLDGDGIEDAVIVARAKAPLAGETQFHYKVIDPFFTAYGYGDPKITGTLSSEDPENRNLLLVIHGAGKDAWRAAEPKAKFVMINLPIENIMVRQTMIKKRTVGAIDPQSTESNGAMVVWDGKKYRWLEGNGK